MVVSAVDDHTLVWIYVVDPNVDETGCINQLVCPAKQSYIARLP